MDNYLDLNLEENPGMKQILDNEYDSDLLDEETSSECNSDVLMLEIDNLHIHENSLFIKTNINHTNLNCLIDSTLNETIISYDDALKINLIDENSNQEYLTKFNNIKVKIEDEIFYFSILVKNESKIIPTIGLDNLKKYKAIINLEGNYLKLGTQVTMFINNLNIENLDKSRNYLKLFEFGFDRTKILNTLEQTNNDFDQSLNLLTLN